MLNLFKVSGDNTSDILYKLLRNLNAKVTRETVRETMLQHPDFPSLLAMSEVLSCWNIDNAALQLNTVEQLREIPLPFVAQLKKKGGWYVLVDQVNEQYIRYTDSELGPLTLSPQEFEKRWTGIVLLAETDVQSGEADYQSKRIREQLANWRGGFILGAAIILIAIALITKGQNYSATEWLLFFTKTCGLLIAGMLTAKQLGAKNGLTDRVCRINDKTSCENVLNSPGAKLWGWLNWSDLGLLYFAGGLVTLIFAGSQPGVLPLLNNIALPAMLYVGYSVYYQAYRIRQWCTLCLAVQLVLIVEGLFALTHFTTPAVSIGPYLALLFGFLLPSFAWVIAKPLLTNRIQGRRDHEELLALKRDPAIFKALLLQQPKAPPIIADLQAIVSGEFDAGCKITIVTDPYCNSCSKAHRELEQLALNDQDVSITTIFSTSSNSSPATKVATHLLALAGQGTLAAEALADWYGQKNKDYDDWASRFPSTTHPLDLVAVCEDHRKWCSDANIMVTPTIYINGYQMPENYKLESLPWLLKRIDFDKVLEANA